MKKLFSLFLISILVVASASAAIRTAVTGNWHVSTAASNTAWGGISLTTTADTCIIPNGVTVTVISTNVTCGALIVEAGGTLTFQSSSSRSVVVASGGGYFGTVTINGTVAMANSNGQFIQYNGPSFTVGSGSSWTWAGTSSGTDGGINYAGTTNTTIFGNGKTIGRLRVTGAGGTVTLNGDINFRGQGTTGPCITLGTSTSNLIVPTGTTLTLSANGSSTNDFSITSGGKITLNGTAVLDNRAGTTGTIAGAGALTLNGTSRYIHNHNGSTLIGAVASTVSYGSGTTCEIRGIVGATSFAAGSQSFQNFIWNNAGQTSGCNFTASLTSIAGTFDIQNSNNQNVRLTGNTAGLVLNITGDLKISGLNGISRLDMCNGTGNPTVNVTGNVEIGGNSFAATLLSANAANLKVRGNWTNGTNGTFTSANTTVEFNSATANQSITKTGGETFNSLIINNTFGGTGVTLANNATVTTSLAFLNGKVQTGANKITLTTPSSGLLVGGPSSYVNGTLERAIAAGATVVVFPVGDANNYAPVSLAFGAGNAAGNVTASTLKPGIPPAAGNPPTGSGISQTKYIDRSWTFSTTIGSPDYAATFTYINPGDVVGGANTSALIIGKDNGGTWSNPGVASSVSPSVTSVTGQTSFSTFYLGEAGACINNTFSGTGDWTDGTKWSCGAPPSSGDNVTIAASANATLDVDFTVAGTLTMTATSTLTVNPTRTLAVSGSADFAGQSVTFKSDNTGTASLGQVSGTLSGASNVTVERYIPNNGFRSWRLLSVPVTTSQTIRQAWQEGDANPNPKDNNVANYGTQITGVFGTQAAATAAGFDSTSVQAGMLRWNGASWSNITSTNQAINNFNSYFLYIRGDRSLTVTGSVNSSNATTLRTKGTVYTGDQTTNVGASAFALVPNLYPSAINFTGLTRTGGVNNLFYIWDSKKLNGQSLGVYQTFSNTNSFNCLISGGSYTLGVPNTTIESGQSFFVTSGLAGTIVLKETAKISGTNGSLGFRPTPSAVRASIGTRLYNSSDEMLDANTVVFDAVYSKAVADEDAPKMGNPGANFAIETGSKLLAIEGTAPVKENDAIQFRMWNMAAGNYKLEFAISNLSLPAGTEAILEDSYTKTNTVLNTSVATNVNFTVDASPASSAANRFRIVIGKAGVYSKAGFSIAPNPIEGNTMNLVFSQQAAGQYNVRIVSANGQAMSTYRLMHAGGNANQVINLPAVMGNGTYTVEIVSPDKARTVKTVLVSKK